VEVVTLNLGCIEIPSMPKIMDLPPKDPHLQLFIEVQLMNITTLFLSSFFPC